MMIRTIGFTDRYDRKIIVPQLIDCSEENGQVFLGEPERILLLEYLRNCPHVFSITLGLFDGSEYIGPYVLYSDGEWIWPSHMVSSIERGKLNSINKTFMDHVQKLGFHVPQLTVQQLAHVKKFIETNLLNI